MPKVSNTRKQRADELLERLKRGPAFSNSDLKDLQTLKYGYELWVNSWIISEVIDLIPELRAKKLKERST